MFESLGPEYTLQAMTLVLLLSLPPIIVAASVGLLVSFVLALTQLQEQTLTFGIKLIAVTLALVGTAAWYGDQLILFSIQMFDSIATIGR